MDSITHLFSFLKIALLFCSCVRVYFFFYSLPMSFFSFLLCFPALERSHIECWYMQNVRPRLAEVTWGFSLNMKFIYEIVVLAQLETSKPFDGWDEGSNLGGDTMWDFL